MADLIIPTTIVRTPGGTIVKIEPDDGTVYFEDIAVATGEDSAYVRTGPHEGLLVGHDESNTVKGYEVDFDNEVYLSNN